MPRKYPQIEFTESALREGMQIEDAHIAVDDKVRLLDVLSETGVKKIVVGSFVSPRYTPQMARIDEIVQKFHPKPGVTYTCVMMNERGVDRARQYSPPLTIERESLPSLHLDLDDIFLRRNNNRSHQQALAQWPKTIATAQERGVKEASLGVGSPWGGNFIGHIPPEVVMKLLELQHNLWDNAGIKVTSCSLADAMGCNMPHRVKENLVAIKERWPDITHWSLHLHNAHGMAMASAFTALDTLTEEDTIHLESTLGGFGGCPYSGCGRANGMLATEDLVNMAEEMGIYTGIDLKKLIECVWMCEEIVGRPLWGHVSKAGWIPKPGEEYDPNMPFVETMEQSRHFLRGPAAYEGGVMPWREPITSPYKDRMKKGLPAFDLDDKGFPWSEPWFPKATK